MMNREDVQFDAKLARIYDATRPINPDVCRACFRDALQTVIGESKAKVIDVGCGTGRILECLVPDLLEAEQIVAIDISPAMLALAKGKRELLGIKYHNISALEFASKSEHLKHFDVVICHWLFHCLPNWEKVLYACVNLAKPNGVLIWLLEEGDLYQALDGMGTGNLLISRLFDTYYEAVNRELCEQGLERMEPASRSGAALRCTEDLANELTTYDWSVHLHLQTYQWKSSFVVGWIISEILQQRAFTNLRRIPESVNVRAVSELKQKLGKDGLPAIGDSIELNFWTKAVTAISSS